MAEVQTLETSKQTEKLQDLVDVLRCREGFQFQPAEGRNFLDEVVSRVGRLADVTRAAAIYGLLTRLDPNLKIPRHYNDWRFDEPNYEDTTKPWPAEPHVGPLAFGNMQREIAELRAESGELRTQIELLSAELRKNVPHLQLYRFGAGALSLSAFSLLSWWIVGISIPFHPIFATVTIPTAIGFMAMAWIAKSSESTRSKPGRNGTVS